MREEGRGSFRAPSTRSMFGFARHRTDFKVAPAIAVAALLVIAGCGPALAPNESAVVGHPGGCTLYRTNAGWRYVYSTVCPDGTASTSYRVQQGKASHEETVDTVGSSSRQ